MEDDPKPKAPLPRGRPRGSKNKATLEKERQAQLAVERERILEEVRVQDAISEVREAKANGRKLMKEIAFDFAHMFAGLAAFYQPYPKWITDPATGKAVNANPNFNEAKFKEYAVLARDTALGAASYESPKLSAMMVGQAVVTEIEVVGGLPDEEDGSLYAAATDAEQLTDARPDAGAGGAANVPSEASGTVPAAGQAQGGPVRKALG